MQVHGQFIIHQIINIFMNHLKLLTLLLLLCPFIGIGQTLLVQGDSIDMLISKGIEIDLVIVKGDTVYSNTTVVLPPPDPLAFSASTTGQTANSFSFTATQNKAGKIKYVALTQADAVGLDDADKVRLIETGLFPAQTTFLIDAKTGTLGANWEIITDGIRPVIGNTSDAPVSTDTDRKVQYTFTVEEAGKYTVWARMEIQSGSNANSFFIGLNDSDDTYLFNRGGNNSDGFQWSSTHLITGSNPGKDLQGDPAGTVTYQMNPGAYTLELYNRELCEISHIYITKNGDTPTDAILN